MKIVFVSNHNPHFANTNKYRIEVFEQSGHQVVFFEDRNFIIPGRIRDKISFFHNWDIARINRNLLKSLKQTKPDVCLVVGGSRIVAETVRKIQTMDIKVVLWTADVPKLFENLKIAVPYYDYIFCSGSEMIGILKKMGLASKTFWLPFSCDPHYHRPLKLSEEDYTQYKKDIVFVGSYYPNRAKTLEVIADMDLAVWGPHWNNLSPDSPLKEKVVDARLNYDQWVKIYNAAKIVMVIHFDDGQTPCDQASPKLYEAMACKRCVFVDDQKDVQALFEHEKHVVIFKDKNDLRKKIDYYLKYPEKRAKIAQAGYEEVVKKHTYQHRIQEMLSIIKKG